MLEPAPKPAEEELLVLIIVRAICNKIYHGGTEDTEKVQVFFRALRVSMVKAFCGG